MEPNIISVLGTASKGFVRGLEELEIGGRTETILNYSRILARILRRVLETWRDLLALRLQWNTNAAVKNE